MYVPCDSSQGNTRAQNISSADVAKSTITLKKFSAIDKEFQEGY